MSETTPEPEEWRPVPGYEGIYETSYSGLIWSVPRVRANGQPHGGRLMSAYVGNNGYLTVRLSKNGRSSLRTVHSIVCEAFHGPCPEGMTQVRHLDGVRTHNEASNLKWGTPSEDNFDRVEHGTHQYANREKCSEGHDLSGDNLSIRRSADGSFKARVCLQCRRDRAARITAEKPLIPVVCGYCGTLFEKPQTVGKARRRYCSLECQTAMRNAQSLAWQRARISTK